MSKINLIDVESGYNLSRINDNFKEVKRQLDNLVLYRDNPVGEPNSMGNDLDMDSHRVYNLPVPLTDNEAARLADVKAAISGANSANLVSFAPYKSITSTNVQGAIQELEDELENISGDLVEKVSKSDLANDVDFSKGAALVGHTGVPDYGGNGPTTLRTAVLNKLYPTAQGGTDTRGVDLHFDTVHGALRYGGSDPAPTNDEQNYWRGFAAPVNAWGNPANIGVYSVSFNRNGMAVAPYSSTFGHDCIAMGTASIAGGAGSATGDPDDPLNVGYLFNGYCSIAWGKNCLAGEKASAFGDTTTASSRGSFAAGVSTTARVGLVSDPGGVASDGLGATALGYQSIAAGDGAMTLGKFIGAYSGSQLIGSGINQSNRMQNTSAGTVGMGANVVIPTIECLPGDGTVGGLGQALIQGPLILRGTAGEGNLEGVRHSTILTNGGAGGYFGWDVYLRKAGVVTKAFYSDGVTLNWSPSADGTQTLGDASHRWSTVYAATGTINTSDARTKQQITTDLAPELRAWAKVKFSKFKFNDAVQAKGDGARWHFGVIAQEVKAAFESEGLDPFAYGILCYDEWGEQAEVKDDKGVVTQSYRAAGNRYGIRYEEALALECAYLRSKLA